MQERAPRLNDATDVQKVGVDKLTVHQALKHPKIKKSGKPKGTFKFPEESHDILLQCLQKKQ
jgi:hypothetical protein